MFEISSRVGGVLGMTIAAALLWPILSHAQPKTPTNKFPRIANYYLGSLNRADYEKLARYDLLILIPETQYYFRDFFDYARARNPHIIILPYVPSQSINLEGLNDPDGLKRAFFELGTEARFLHTPQGGRISLLRDILPVANVTTDWVDVMPRVVQEKILSTGLWDGIFYDIVESNINHYGGGDIDINNDGVRDDIRTVNALWRDGMTKLLTNTRAMLGSNQYLVINGDSYEPFQQHVNGRMFESFPTPWEGRGTWVDSMNAYLRLGNLNVSPTSIIINNDTRDQGGGQQNWRLMRYGLTSALLSNGYSGFDYGITSHYQLWWFDEYEAFLGRPVSNPTNVRGGTGIVPSLWRRDFEKGAVFINATNEIQEIVLEEEFERIHGQQDPSHNNGMTADRITLAANDGVIVLRPIAQATGVAFTNGAFARVFSGRGSIKRSGFFTYTNLFRGTSTVAQLTNRREKLWIATNGGSIRAVDEGGNTRWTIFPYGENFRGSITFALGDLNGDGRKDILTVPARGGSVHIRAFTTEGAALPVNFIADRNQTLVPSIAVLQGSTPNDTRIVLGATKGQRPYVRLYALNGTLARRWGAFEGSATQGMSVAVAKFHPTDEARILVGRGAGAAPEVRIFTQQEKLIGLFYAFARTNRSGVRVAATDLDGNGGDEILASTTQVYTTARR